MTKAAPLRMRAEPTQRDIATRSPTSPMLCGVRPVSSSVMNVTPRITASMEVRPSPVQ